MFYAEVKNENKINVFSFKDTNWEDVPDNILTLALEIPEGGSVKRIHLTGYKSYFYSKEGVSAIHTTTGERYQQQIAEVIAGVDDNDLVHFIKYYFDGIVEVTCKPLNEVGFAPNVLKQGNR